jgi:hypothetical protein
MNRTDTTKMFNAIIFIAVVAAGGLFSLHRSPSICRPIYPTAQSKEMVDTLDKQSSQFASTTADITDR